MASYSRALRNSILATESLKAAIAGYFITVYDGPVPNGATPGVPDAEVAITASNHVLGVYKAYDSGGTPMNSNPTGGLTWGAASAGSLEKNTAEIWKTIAANTHAGTATFARIQASDDTSGDDTSTPAHKRIQLTMSGSGSADWVQSSLVYTEGGEKTITAAYLSLPSLE